MTNPLDRSMVRLEPDRGSGKEEEATLHHHGSFKAYMHNKNLKLREQFEAQSFHLPQRSNIFAGVSIHVNGYTVPTHHELKQLMALHGGRFETYYYRDRVTHIICANLPDTKLKQLVHERAPPPIVRPEWVTASIQAGALLPVRDFLLETIRDAPGQRRLTGFKRHAEGALAAADMYPNLAPAEPGGGQAPMATGAAVDGPAEAAAAAAVAVAAAAPHSAAPAASAAAPAAGDAGCRQHQRQQPSMDAPPGSSSAAGPPSAGLPLAGHLLPSAAAAAERPPPLPPAAAPSAQPSASDPAPRSHAPVQPVVAAGGRGQTAGAVAVPDSSGPAADLAKAQQTAAQLRAACDVLKGRPRSSADDPEGFVASFFKSSRLHFIGSWKARIEQLLSEQQGAGPAPLQPATAQQQKARLMFSGKAGAAGEGGAVTPVTRTVIHVDMDCFFAAVAAIGRPEFVGKPLAVCHSASDKGSGEVSSANYEARAFGIRAGMFMAEAKARCPDLLVVPYEFDKYTTISEQVYRILMSVSTCVQPLSCDEALLDVTGLGDPQQLAASLRQRIEQATQCTASAGIGPNLLLARLATKRAKPNGQYQITPDQALAFLGDLPVDDLPGVGWSLRAKLAELGITKVRQVWGSSKENLVRKLGQATGNNLWNFAHGRDERPVEPPKGRKSVGAEVNWGVRFTSEDDAAKFLQDLCCEVAGRLSAAGARAKSITLKVKRRQAGAPEPAKFLGHGACDNISRSVTLARYAATAGELLKEGMGLLAALQIPVEEIRGLGITVSKLDTEPSSRAVKPSAPAPAKLPPAHHTVFDPSKPPAWMAFYMQQEADKAATAAPGTAAGVAAAGPGSGAPESPAAAAAAAVDAAAGRDALATDKQQQQAEHLADTLAKAMAASSTITTGLPGGGRGSGSSSKPRHADVPSWYASLYNDYMGGPTAWQLARGQQPAAAAGAADAPNAAAAAVDSRSSPAGSKYQQQQQQRQPASPWAAGAAAKQAPSAVKASAAGGAGADGPAGCLKGRRLAPPVDDWEESGQQHHRQQPHQQHRVGVHQQQQGQQGFYDHHDQQQQQQRRPDDHHGLQQWQQLGCHAPVATTSDCWSKPQQKAQLLDTEGSPSQEVALAHQQQQWQLARQTPGAAAAAGPQGMGVDHPAAAEEHDPGALVGSQSSLKRRLFEEQQLMEEQQQQQPQENGQQQLLEEQQLFEEQQQQLLKEQPQEHSQQQRHRHQNGRQQQQQGMGGFAEGTPAAAPGGASTSSGEQPLVQLSPEVVVVSPDPPATVADQEYLGPSGTHSHGLLPVRQLGIPQQQPPQVGQQQSDLQQGQQQPHQGRQQLQQGQRQRSRLPHPTVPAAAAGASPPAATPPGALAVQRRVAVLPSPSDLDPEVLDALPLALRKELEWAYGLRLDSPGKMAQQRRAQQHQRGQQGVLGGGPRRKQQVAVTTAWQRLAAPGKGSGRAGMTGVAAAGGGGAKQPAVRGGQPQAPPAGMVVVTSGSAAAAAVSGGGQAVAGPGGTTATPAAVVSSARAPTTAPPARPVSISTAQPAAAGPSHPPDSRQSPRAARRRPPAQHSVSTAAGLPGGGGPLRPSAPAPLTLTQIDPSVLSELPAELQAELLAALPQSKAAVVQRGAGKQGMGAAALAGPAHQQQQQSKPGAGLLQVWGLRPDCDEVAGFVEEPWSQVFAALQEAVHQLCGHSSAGPAPAGATGASGAPLQGGRSGGGIAAAATGPAPLSPAASAAADGAAALHFGAAAPPAAAAATSAGPAAVPSAAPACTIREVGPRLRLLVEYLQRWLVAHDTDLQLVATALQDVLSLAAIPGFRVSAQQLVEGVQRGVRSKYGFQLALKLGAARQ